MPADDICSCCMHTAEAEAAVAEGRRQPTGLVRCMCCNVHGRVGLTGAHAQGQRGDGGPGQAVCQAESGADAARRARVAACGDASLAMSVTQVPQQRLS